MRHFVVSSLSVVKLSVAAYKAIANSRIRAEVLSVSKHLLRRVAMRDLSVLDFACNTYGNKLQGSAQRWRQGLQLQLVTWHAKLHVPFGG